MYTEIIIRMGKQSRNPQKIRLLLFLALYFCTRRPVGAALTWELSYGVEVALLPFASPTGFDSIDP